MCFSIKILKTVLVYNFIYRSVNVLLFTIFITLHYVAFRNCFRGNLLVSLWRVIAVWYHLGTAFFILFVKLILEY